MGSHSFTLCSFVSQGHIRDITDSLIEHCQDKRLDENANVQLSDDKVISIIFDLFGAGMCSSVYNFCAQVSKAATYLTSPSVLSCSGFDTVTTAISWSLMYLVTNPRVQRKIQEELGRWWLHSKDSKWGTLIKSWQPLNLLESLYSVDTVIGRSRRPRFSDRPQLPYLEAFILEVFRHSSFVPFTVPHRSGRP